MNAINNHEVTTAHIAARKGNLNIVKYILEKDPSILTTKKCNGERVLLMAIKNEHLDIVKYLVEVQKVPIEQRFSNRYYGNTAIHFAAEYNCFDILKYFLDNRKGDVNVENDVQQTPLFSAVENRHHTVVKYLIEEKGANVNKVDYMGDTLLDKAVNEDDYVMLRYLINERKMKVSTLWRDDLLHRAASFDRLDLMKYLVSELHANINKADQWGKTPLHKAAIEKHYDICAYLIEHGASTKLRDLDGKIPAQETTDERLIGLFENASEKRD